MSAQGVSAGNASYHRSRVASIDYAGAADAFRCVASAIRGVGVIERTHREG